jgi:hypothetical protein
LIYTEADASELTKDIELVIDTFFDVDGDSLKKAKNEILQLIRKKLKLTRSYKIISAIKSHIHVELAVEQEDFVENTLNFHHGFRLLFGEIQDEDDEIHNIKFLTAKEIRFLQRIFKSILRSCDHVEKKQWKKVNMGIGEHGEKWYHYICPCNIVQDVEIIFEA